MYHRIGSAAYKADLNNTIALVNLIDNPQKKFKSIHIAGTNGKGSVSHLLSSILQASGLKVGLYTSPHLKDYRERIRINGKVIEEEYVTNFVENYKISFDEIKPSFFEWTVALAFKYFAESDIDIAVVETGLGGRLDSTNIIIPFLSIITNISYDHTALLGDSLQNIAYEKAGIIKQNVPIVVGESTDASKNVFIDRANDLNAPIYFADKLYSINNIKYTDETIPKLKIDVCCDNKIIHKDLICQLIGNYQQKNILTVVASINLLKNIGYNIADKDIYMGFANVVDTTGLMGRWQILNKEPLTIADVGHNIDGITEIVKQINITPHHQLHFVIGMVNDKDIDGVLALLPKHATYYFCKPNIPRGMDANTLMDNAIKFDLKGKAYQSVALAFDDAKNNAATNDMIFVGGSNFVVAEVI